MGIHELLILPMGATHHHMSTIVTGVPFQPRGSPPSPCRSQAPPRAAFHPIGLASACIQGPRALAQGLCHWCQYLSKIRLKLRFSQTSSCSL